MTPIPFSKNILVTLITEVVSLLILKQITADNTAHIIHSHYAQITFESKHRVSSVKEANDSLYSNAFYIPPLVTNESEIVSLGSHP